MGVAARLRMATANPLAGVAVGDAFMGGYFVGIIDTTKGNIIAADNSQSGLRYALIISPLSLEVSGAPYKNANTPAPATSSTRWDGLVATTGMTVYGPTFPAAFYCSGLTYPSDGGSQWYLPAMDELELLYRNLKPTSENNSVGTRVAGTFPGTTATFGENVSSDPAGGAYTTGNPAQTPVLPFRVGGAQALAGVVGTSVYYWASTEAAYGAAWAQCVSGPTGYQDGFAKYSGSRVRPVRRLVL